MTRGSGRGARKGMASSMKSCPAMKGEDDCENEEMCCDFLVMKRSKSSVRLAIDIKCMMCGCS